MNDIILHLIKNIKVPIGIIIIIIFFLTPIFTFTASLVQDVRANTRQLQEHNRRIIKTEMLDEKVSEIMIEMGIQKKLREIEDRYEKQSN